MSWHTAPVEVTHWRTSARTSGAGAVRVLTCEKRGREVFSQNHSECPVVSLPRPTPGAMTDVAAHLLAGHPVAVLGVPGVGDAGELGVEDVEVAHGEGRGEAEDCA